MPVAFKGNKRNLPSKMCVACGREMTWRKKWEKNWEQVKYCSKACRGQGGTEPAIESSKANPPG